MSLRRIESPTAGQQALDTATIRRLRGAKAKVDPWRAQGVVDETERLLNGESQRCRTVFLTGAECPFTCVFCDLWRFTLDGPTPAGALPRQLEEALEDGLLSIDCLKLYNASNFFDERAVPSEDLPAIAQRVAAISRVVVECHPRWVDQRSVEFAERLDGRLELALGLETAHPEALSRLNKQVTLDDFDRACDFARCHQIGLRAFILIGAPFVPAEQSSTWTLRSVRHAIDQGVEHVSLIPVRGGNGALSSLAASGLFKPPSPTLIEESFAAALETAGDRAVVTLDLWDIKDHFGEQACCTSLRIQRLEEMNAHGQRLPAIECPHGEGQPSE